MGAVPKRHVPVELEQHGYPGESLSIWVNFPAALKARFFELAGESEIVKFLIESKILASSTFRLDDDRPVPLAELPWDVLTVAIRAVVDEIVKINKAIGQGPKAS